MNSCHNPLFKKRVLWRPLRLIITIFRKVGDFGGNYCMQKINISNLPSANKFFIEPSTQSHLKTLWRASKVSQRVKVTAAKPGNLRLIPRTHMIGRGNQLPQSCPLTYMHGTYMPINTGCTHKFCKSNNNHSEDIKLCSVYT